MLAIILFILKLVGIIFLVILGILLFLLLLILLCPFCYRVDVDIEDNAVVLKARIHYLFGLVKGGFAFPEDGVFRLKILFFTLLSIPDNRKKTQQLDVVSSDMERTESGQTVAEQTESGQTDVERTESRQTDVERTESGQTDAERTESGQTESEQTDAKQSDSEDKSKDRKTSIVDKIAKLKYTLMDKYDKMKKSLSDVSFYKRLITDEKTVGYIQSIFHRFGRILKVLLPRKIKGFLHIGLAAPDTTGEIFAVWATVCHKPLFKRFKLLPDFDEECLEGNVCVKGHFCLISILVQGLVLVLDRRLHIIRKRIKYHKNPELRNKNKKKGKHKKRS